MTGADVLTIACEATLMLSGGFTIWAVRSRGAAWREAAIMTDQRNQWCDASWAHQDRAEKAEASLAELKLAHEALGNDYLAFMAGEPARIDAAYRSRQRENGLRGAEASRKKREG